MAYVYDHVAATPRRDGAPCLAAWGAVGAPVMVGGRGGGDRLVLVFRTRRDVFISFRGMDGLSELPKATRVQPVFDAPFFGAPLPERPPPPQLPLAAYRTQRPFADPRLFWVLRKDYDDARALDTALAEAVSSQIQQMDAASRPSARVWLTGHSSGGALAQLMALRLSSQHSFAIGGVFLFNSDRVGSAGFAAHYDSHLGNVTLRYGYGHDNANMASNMAMGLRFPGRGFWACPQKGRPVEALAALPLGQDTMNACKGVTPWPRQDDLETKDDVARRWRVPLMPKLAVLSTVAEWDSFSHHFPHLLFDSLLRILGPQVDTCVMKALRNSQCVVSRGCTVALRPAGDTRCLTCADDSTCTEFWGLPGYRCDSRPSLTASGLCHRPLPYGVAPTLAGLFFMRWSNASAAGAAAADNA